MFKPSPEEQAVRSFLFKHRYCKPRTHHCKGSRDGLSVAEQNKKAAQGGESG